MPPLQILSGIGFALTAGVSFVICFFAFFMSTETSASAQERRVWWNFVLLSLINMLFCLAGSALNLFFTPESLLLIAGINAGGMLLAPAFYDFVRSYVGKEGWKISVSSWAVALLFTGVFLLFPGSFITSEISFPAMPVHYYRYSPVYYLFMTLLFIIIFYSLLLLRSRGKTKHGWRRDMRYTYPACIFWSFCGFWDAILSSWLRMEYYISWLGGLVVMITFLEAVVNRSREAFQVQHRHMLIVRDLADARLIQRNLIINKFPEFRNIMISGMFRPMEQVGGDFYDVRRLDDRYASIFISDVSGHGIASAFITAMLKVSLESLPTDLLYSPEGVLEHLNRSLETKIAGRYITAIYGIFDTEELKFTYTSAGHDPPILRFRSADRSIIALPNRGRILGVFPTLENDLHTVVLEPGDRLLFLTDGIVEEINDAGEMFGLSRVSAILTAVEFEGLENIFTGVASFTGNRKETGDDMAAVLVEVMELQTAPRTSDA